VTPTDLLAGLGLKVLDWAAHHALDHGVWIHRLDYARANTRLRRSYRAAGFTEVGEREFEDGPSRAVTLYEQGLDWPSAGPRAEQ
jgi:hypothetical protein